MKRIVNTPGIANWETDGYRFCAVRSRDRYFVRPDTDYASEFCNWLR